MHGIRDNSWNLPSHRFSNLVMTFLKDDKVPEGIEKINDAMNESDSLPHPFYDPRFQSTISIMSNSLTNNSTTTKVGNVIYDSRLTDLPIEEKKRLEAKEKGKPYRVPEWWRGEKANYKVAKSMMGVLPKKIGPVKEN